MLFTGDEMLEKLEGIKAALSTRTYLIVKQELEDLEVKRENEN